jgi:hypothetical protein
MTACPKPQRIKSKALTDSAKGRECTARWAPSRHDPDTVVFCHVRINSGVGTKPPDFFGYFGCVDCHASEDEIASARQILRAVCETQYLMAVDGLLAVKGWNPR